MTDFFGLTCMSQRFVTFWILLTLLLVGAIVRFWWKRDALARRCEALEKELAAATLPQKLDQWHDRRRQLGRDR